MNVKKEIQDIMLSCHKVPPEMGGIIGERYGIVDTVIVDLGVQGLKPGVYSPNIDFINQIIDEWCEVGINFVGIFHTHAKQWPNLSSSDQKYIEKIMCSMPQNVDKLLFPLVFPGEYIKWYIAEKQIEGIEIYESTINIV